MPICKAPEGYLYAQDGPCPAGQDPNAGIVQTVSPMHAGSGETIGGDIMDGGFGWEDFIGGSIPGGGSWGINFPSLPPISVNVGGGGGGGDVGGEFVPMATGQMPTLRVQSAAACIPGYTLRKKPKRCPSKFGECVPKRHMNSLNPHALRRATRRLSGFFNHVKSAEKAVRSSLGHVARTTHRRGGCTYCGKTGRSCRCG